MNRYRRTNPLSYYRASSNQKGFIGLIGLLCILSMLVTCFLFINGKKGIDLVLRFFRNADYDFLFHEVLFTKTVVGGLSAILIIAALAYLMDRFVRMRTVIRAKKLEKMADKFNLRFQTLQNLMINNFALYQSHESGTTAIRAIGAARSILGTLNHRLENTALLLSGQERTHIYDAWTQVSRPLTACESSLASLMQKDEFPPTKISMIPSMLEQLLDAGAEPLKALVNNPLDRAA